MNQAFSALLYCLKSTMSIGVVSCILFVVLNKVIKTIAIGDRHYIKSTMATFAIGFPLGVLSLRDIALNNWSVVLFLIYFLFCVFLWVFAYVLETPIKHPTFQVWKQKIKGGVCIDIIYILLGIISTKSLKIIKFFGDHLLPPIISS